MILSKTTSAFILSMSMLSSVSFAALEGTTGMSTTGGVLINNNTTPGAIKPTQTTDGAITNSPVGTSPVPTGTTGTTDLNNATNRARTAPICATNDTLCLQRQNGPNTLTK